MFKNIKNALMITLLFIAPIAQCSKFGEKILDINHFILESGYELIDLGKNIPGGKLVLSTVLAIGGVVLLVKGANITYKNGKELYNELVKIIKKKTFNYKNIAQNFGKGVLGISLIFLTSPIHGVGRSQLLRSL